MRAKRSHDEAVQEFADNPVAPAEWRVMRRECSSTRVGLAVASLLLSAAIQGGQALLAQTQIAPAASTSLVVRLMDAGGPLTAMEICFSNPPQNPSDPSHGMEYLTAAFEVPVDALRAVPELEPAFAGYLNTTYHARLNVTCQPIWSIADAQTVQKKIIGDRDRAKLKMVNTGWRYGQPPLAQGQSGFDPLAAGPGGLDLSQHRLTTYLCSLSAPGGTTMAQTDKALANQVTYVSPVFQADWNATPVDRAFDVYIRSHFVHDLALSDTRPRCSAQSPAMQAMMHERAMISSTDNGRAVPVDFTYTSAQETQATVAQSAEAAHRAAAAVPTAAANQKYVVCASESDGPSIYVSEIFPAVMPPQPAGRPGNGAAERAMAYIIDGFQTRFLAFLQTKYGFKSGSDRPVACLGNFAPNAGGLEAAQRYRQSLEDQVKQNRKSVIETGWTSK
jgi:hypothetical protein